MKHFAFALALLAAACGGKSSAPETTPEGTGDGTETTEPTESNEEVVTLTNLEPGDTGCYVWFSRDGETEESMIGDFALCEGGEQDATALVGGPVTFTIEEGNVLAPECEGDMDCGKSETVDIVMTITAAN